jgi:jumonji domain-containing protein 2
VRLSPPAEGEVIQIKWLDGKPYRAKYLGPYVACVYQVELEDGFQIVMERTSILDEELPERAKTPLSQLLTCSSKTVSRETSRGEEETVLRDKLRKEYVDDPVHLTVLKSSFQKKCQRRQKSTATGNRAAQAI